MIYSSRDKNEWMEVFSNNNSRSLEYKINNICIDVHIIVGRNAILFSSRFPAIHVGKTVGDRIVTSRLSIMMYLLGISVPHLAHCLNYASKLFLSLSVF